MFLFVLTFSFLFVFQSEIRMWEARPRENRDAATLCDGKSTSFYYINDNFCANVTGQTFGQSLVLILWTLNEKSSLSIKFKLTLLLWTFCVWKHSSLTFLWRLQIILHPLSYTSEQVVNVLSVNFTSNVSSLPCKIFTRER